MTKIKEKIEGHKENSHKKLTKIKKMIEGH